MAISLLVYLAIFSGQLCFREDTFSEKVYFRRSFIFGETLFLEKLYFTEALFQKLLLHISLEQLFRHSSYIFGDSYFFRAAAFLGGASFSKDSFSCSSCFFIKAIFFRSETSTEQPLLENRKLFRGVTFRKSYFFADELIRIKTSTKEFVC